MEALEASAYPGTAPETPESTREFLETESAFAGGEGRHAPIERNSRERSPGLEVGVPGAGERLVVYPARDGHASYHMPKRYSCGMIELLLCTANGFKTFHFRSAQFLSHARTVAQFSCGVSSLAV